VEGTPGDCSWSNESAPSAMKRPWRRRTISRPAPPIRSASARSSGGAIENELHWVLDMTFDEDRSRVRDRNSTMNLALLRKLALSLLKREQSDPRKSIAMKRRRAGWDNDTLFTVLAAAVPNPS
jgi:hypothetical protein